MNNTVRSRWAILIVLVAVGLASALWGASQGDTGWDWGGLALNLGTEMIGAVAIYAVLERLIGGRERLEADKQRLIAELGSSVHDVAIPAAEELRRRRWLTDGSLSGAYLYGADLYGADLYGADLREADLHGAKLSRANLLAADLGQRIEEGGW